MSNKHNLWGTNAIEVRNNDLGSAMRKLKKYLFKENVLEDYRRHEAYEKPSVKKRRTKNEAIRRNKKELQERKEFF